MKSLFLMATLGGACACVHAQTEPFAGAWSVRVCTNSEKACGELHVFLTQRGTRVCGAHFSTAPGAVDDGTPLSIVGTAIGASAVVVVSSARDGSTFLVRLDRNGRRIDWAMTESLDEGDGGEAPLLPPKARLSPENAPVAMEEVRTECNAHYAEGN